MKIKNLKGRKKSLCLATCGFVLLEGMVYGGFCKGIGKPFTKGEYEAHKVTVRENTPLGLEEKCFYAIDDYDEESIVVKTPYSITDDGNVEREIFFCDTDNVSNVEKNFIIDNVSDQKLLFSQDYIRELVRKIDYGDLEFYNYEQVQDIPEDNNYEIGYATFDTDLNDVQMVNSLPMDTLISVGYTLASIIPLGIYICVCGNIKAKEEEKTKVKEKTK